MKINRLGRFWLRTTAIALCGAYLGLKFKGMMVSLVEMTWGMAVFFTCVYWFSEVEE